MYLIKNEIDELIFDKKEIIIRPLLQTEQIGEVAVDFRLGTDFLMSFQGRNSMIDVSNNETHQPASSYFQETRRVVGTPFLFHPMQTVLCSSLEYVKLPSDIGISLTMRSSYSRLGLSVSSFIQPGYSGCIPMELTNVNNVPVQIAVGARIVQARFFRISNPTNYFAGKRKYICQVRPEVSFANLDEEVNTLKKVGKKGI
jgi:dCTP deaminase